MPVRVKMSGKQFALFDKGRKPKGSPRVKKRKEDLPENQLEARVLSYLAVRGWSTYRQQSGLFARPFDPDQRVRVGIVGELDWRSERPVDQQTKRLQPEREPIPHHIFYWEAKAPGCVPSDHQAARILDLHVHGTSATWFDSFDEGPHSFMSYYRAMFL